MPGLDFEPSSPSPMSFEEKRKRDEQSATIMGEVRRKSERRKMGFILSMFGALAIAATSLTTCNVDAAQEQDNQPAAGLQVKATPSPVAEYDSLVSDFDEASNEITYTSYRDGRIWNQSIARQGDGVSFIRFPYREGQKTSGPEWIY